MAPVRSWLLLAAAPFALVPAPAVPVDGVSRSQGYGYVFAIEGRMLRAFEVTATTCVPAFTAERDPADVPGREATFKTPEGQTYFIRDGGPDDHKRLHSEGSASDVRIDRCAAAAQAARHVRPPDGEYPGRQLSRCSRALGPSTTSLSTSRRLTGTPWSEPPG